MRFRPSLRDGADELGTLSQGSVRLRTPPWAILVISLRERTEATLPQTTHSTSYLITPRSLRSMKADQQRHVLAFQLA